MGPAAFSRAPNGKATLGKYCSASVATTAVSGKQRRVSPGQSCLIQGHCFLFARHVARGPNSYHVPKAGQNLRTACLCSLVEGRSTFPPSQPRTSLYSRRPAPSRLKGSAYHVLAMPLAPTSDPSSQVLARGKVRPQKSGLSFSGLIAPFNFISWAYHNVQ